MSIAEPMPAAVVLVAEDEELVRLVAAEALRGAGVSVLEAKDAADAIHVLSNTSGIHVVFTDVRMPGQLDGIDLAHFVKTHHPHIDVILTSADFNPFAVDSLKDLNIDFIEKPYGIDFLIERIWRALNVVIS